MADDMSSIPSIAGTNTVPADAAENAPVFALDNKNKDSKEQKVANAYASLLQQQADEE